MGSFLLLLFKHDSGSAVSAFGRFTLAGSLSEGLCAA